MDNKNTKSTDIRIVKVSELPAADSFDGLHTLGVDAKNKSVKVSLQEVGEAMDAANDAASTANKAASNANTAANKANEIWQGVESEVEEIRTIAEGTVKALAFDSKQQLEDWIVDDYVRPDGLTVDDLFIGQHLLVVDTNSHDYWWTGTDISPLKSKSGVEVLQTLGDSSIAVVSQKGVTEAIYADPADRLRVQIGDGAQSNSDNSIAIGTSSEVNGENTIAIGNNAQAGFDIDVNSATDCILIGNGGMTAGANHIAIGRDAAVGGSSASRSHIGIGIGARTETPDPSPVVAIGANATSRASSGTAIGGSASILMGAANSIALGYNSVADQSDVLSIGTSSSKRKIINVDDGINASDAATVGQIPPIARMSITPSNTLLTTSEQDITGGRGLNISETGIYIVFARFNASLLSALTSVSVIPVVSATIGVNGSTSGKQHLTTKAMITSINPETVSMGPFYNSFNQGDKLTIVAKRGILAGIQPQITATSGSMGIVAIKVANK